MIWIVLLVMYWTVCGFALWLLPTPYDKYKFTTTYKVLEFGACMLLGGFLVPARFVAKAMQ